jgi:pyrroloquinoline quinone biosynthesis protein B
VRAVPRTQECVAVSADGSSWFLLNVSPEIRAQIESFPPLHPKSSRHSPAAGIVLTNGDLDHCLGLLSLRESHPLTVYATDRVRRGFTEGNVLYRTLQRFPQQVTWRMLKPGHEEEMTADGRPTGLVLSAHPVPGKLPIHLETLLAPDAEDNIALRIRDSTSGRTLAYASAVGAVTPAVRAVLQGADCVMFDGTFWSNDELPAQGLGTSRAEDMAHVPIGGPRGSLALLGAMSGARRIFIHLNNTNPVLRDDSPERQAVTQQGWEVAYDGMEVVL